MNRRFNLDDYETVDARLAAFHAKYPNGRVITDIVTLDGKTVVMVARAYREGDIVASTGHASEVIGSSPINQANALENCETSAVGRALRNLGVTSKGGPSREEMERAVVDPVEETRLVRSRPEFEDLIGDATTTAELDALGKQIATAHGLTKQDKIRLRGAWDRRHAEVTG